MNFLMTAVFANTDVAAHGSTFAAHDGRCGLVLNIGRMEGSTIAVPSILENLLDFTLHETDSPPGGQTG